MTADRSDKVGRGGRKMTATTSDGAGGRVTGDVSDKVCRESEGGAVDMGETLIPPHGGYKKLVTYRLGNLIYDATAAFCAHYFDRKDRTYDQMVQAARSGVANIIEGSEASATSKKTELKLTNVAKASQEELLSDYQAFLRQRSLPEWEASMPEAMKIRTARPENLEQLRRLMAELVAQKNISDDAKRRWMDEVAANVMICLINQETYLLGRQVARLAGRLRKNT